MTKRYTSVAVSNLGGFAVSLASRRRPHLRSTVAQPNLAVLGRQRISGSSAMEPPRTAIFARLHGRLLGPAPRPRAAGADARRRRASVAGALSRRRGSCDLDLGYRAAQGPIGAAPGAVTTGSGTGSARGRRTPTSVVSAPPPVRAARIGRRAEMIERDGDAHIALVGRGACRRVEADPAEPLDMALRPGVLRRAPRRRAAHSRRRSAPECRGCARRR